MRYVSILLLSLFVLSACGKRTEPVPKSVLFDMTPPAKVVVSVTDEGVRIENQEAEKLKIEKGVSEGEECSVFTRLVTIDPKSVYVDTEVQTGTRYFYRLRKKSIKYGVLSEPYMAKIVYAKPMKINSADFRKEGDFYTVAIVTQDNFTRFDAYSGGKTIAQTGGKTLRFPAGDVKDNAFTLILTDYEGNKGVPYEVAIPVEKNPMPPAAVATVSVLNIGRDIRIVWTDSERAQSYNVKACVNVSCETFSTQATSVAYPKQIKSCLDISVTAVNADGESAPKKMRYCKPEEE